MNVFTTVAVLIGVTACNWGFASEPVHAAQGKALIAAPTAFNGPTNQGVWFTSLELPQLPPTQVYEGWLVDECTGQKVSTGLFRADTTVDSDSAGRFAGPLALNFPPVPGSDFVTLGRDITDGAHKIVITIEPYPDSDPNPSGVIALAAAIPAGTKLGTELILNEPSTTTAQSQAVRNIEKYNIEGKLGLKGYDPVAVFAEGGGQVKIGSEDLIYEYMGVVYKFSSQENRELFKHNPSKYEPTYGGWCAYAMASGSLVDIDPNLFTIHGNRIHYFVSARAKRNFDHDLTEDEGKADYNWKNISGESPRL